MCRMIGVVPFEGAFVNSAIFRSFRNLAVQGKVKNGSPAGHLDGWGIVTWLGKVPTYLGREPTDAMTDPKFALACEKIDRLGPDAPVIAHLRKASQGAKTRENTHPFVKGRWAFAHNGTIRKANLKSRTDSEWFFVSLLQEMERRDGDTIQAISNLVKLVHETFNYSSMTFILSDGSKLFAYRDCSRSDDYYTMYFAKIKDGFVVSQEKFFDAPWQDLGNCELLEVDRKLGFKVRSLEKILTV